MKNLKEKFERIKKEIKKAKNILILTHRAPDGDAIGSSLALNLYLKKQKKAVFIYILGASKFLNFLPGFDEIKTKFPRKPNFDLIFALDYAGEERIEIPYHFLLEPKKVISLDHHPGGKRVGKIKIILPKFSSTCEILYYFFESIGEKIDKKMATCLLTGILTDTAGFAFLPQRSGAKVARLLEAGGELSKIMKNYNFLTLPRARLLAKMIERIQKDKELGLIWSYLLLSDFEEQKDRYFLSEPPIFPDFLSQIDRAKVHLFLVEHKNGKVKASLRSHNGIDVAKVARKFGGGGHPSAAGFKIKGKIGEVLEKVKVELKKRTK